MTPKVGYIILDYSLQSFIVSKIQ